MKFTDIARYDKGVVQGETTVTEEGFIKARAIVTRTGVFLYKNADGTIRKELRHPDDVWQLDSLESMKMIPIVNGHPTERLVTSENAKRLSIGFTGETVDKNDPFIISNLVITDSNAIREILSKNKVQLSLGYTVDLEPESGNYYGESYDFRQRNIKYNHLALVDTARAGPEARIALDGEDAEEFQNEGGHMANKRKITIDGEEFLVENEVGEKVESLVQEREKLQARLAEIEAELDVSNAEKDSMAEKLEEVKAKDSNEGKEERETTMQATSKEEKGDASDINAIVKERVRLHKMAERILDKNVLARLDDMSEMEIKKSIIKCCQKNANLDGKTDIYINARFDSVLEDLPKERVIASATKYNEVQLDKADSLSARQNMIALQIKNSHGGK